jgi:hypothetical protein
MTVFLWLCHCVDLCSEEADNVEKFQKRLVKVTKQHNDECKTLLRLMGVPYIEVSWHNFVWTFCFHVQMAMAYSCVMYTIHIQEMSLTGMMKPDLLPQFFKCARWLVCHARYCSVEVIVLFIKIYAFRAGNSSRSVCIILMVPQYNDGVITCWTGFTDLTLMNSLREY